MRLQTCLKIGGAILLTAFVAACGSNYSPTHQPPTNGSLESKFGTEFAAIFDASSTAQPTLLDNGSVPPLQPTAQPVPFS